MEVLAIRQLRILLDLLEEEADILPYVATLTPDERLAIIFVLIQLRNGVDK